MGAGFMALKPHPTAAAATTQTCLTAVLHLDQLNAGNILENGSRLVEDLILDT